ncbi:MAG: M1 family aminopeptidase [Flavobacteriales bacterium]
MRALLLLLFLNCAFLYAQKENSSHCGKRDRYTNHSLKSNSLSVAQIALTERYDVNYYKLDLNMTNTTTALSGYAEMKATALVPLDTILYELFATLSISSVSLNGVNVPFVRTNSAVKIGVNYPAGTVFTIRTNYSGTPPTAQTNPLGGSGMSNATSPSWGNEVVWSLSEPFCAYEWWPCKQSLTDKADSCDINITVPNACKAGSNGKLMNVMDLGNGTSRYEWQHRHPIDYYLISVSVAEYVEYNVYANPVNAPAPILIQNYIYNNPQTLPNFQADIDETADFIELYYDLYGPYPFENEKYGHCMAPFSGGMEHQTMTTQGFFNPNLTAHELGHQWWGDYVTCASWCDIWVNEGFASYSEQLMLEHLYPGQEVQNMLDVHSNVMSQAGGSVWVLDSLNEARIFSGRLTYDKGAAIIHSMRYLMNNDSLFYATLRNFLASKAYATAYGIDVRDAFTQASGIDYTPFFDEWYFGEGYPTYSVEWRQLGSDALVKISHTSSMPNVTPTFTNPIDLKFTRPGTTDTTIRFDITTNAITFQISGIGTINNSIVIDPSNWIVNQNGTIGMNDLLDISALTSDQALTIYPNPSADEIRIQQLVGEARYTIYDMHGKVQQKGIIDNNQAISIKSLLAGAYLMRIETEGKQLKKSFVKQ